MMPAVAELQAAASRDLAAALHALGLSCVVIGGVAVSFVAEPRYTADLDALVIFDTARLSELLDSLGQHGFAPRFRGMADVARQARIVAVTHVASNVAVDLALGCMPFEEEAVSRVTKHQAGDLTLRSPRPRT